MKLKGSVQESAVGCGLIAGVVVTGASLFAAYLFSMGGGMHAVATRNPNTGEVTDAGDWNLLPVTFVFLALGVLLILGSVTYGFMVVRGNRHGRRREIAHFRILARFATNRLGDMLTSDWEIDGAENPRFYVRGTYPGSSVEEYEVSETVFRHCGEGMTGEVEVQGRWIGRFTPYIGTSAAP